MAISSNRLIGLTEELQIEQSCQVQDLHIGWHNEYQAQHQKDPAGHQHRAPVVTWQRHGITYQYVPGLEFVAQDQGYVVDVAQLTSDISQQLRARGNPQPHAA
ncbi:hypothetical protein [Marinobacter xestospongiae]|uniref:Uncharacterized protein n=1 Tax=Marinobacter xestospongiae TaxID=994319 RepID=A0ABU3VSJ4_9GAMM|nr:hypothetical protein [Marinobacter xestospongiae]MDV2077239.1 hypothetical protein [Marinobacter xestospongiae]